MHGRRRISYGWLWHEPRGAERKSYYQHRLDQDFGGALYVADPTRKTKLSAFRQRTGLQLLFIQGLASPYWDNADPDLSRLTMDKWLEGARQL